MDGNRQHSLSDEELDRELAAAVNADPAPEFLARVRTRIAAEATPQRRWLMAPWPTRIAATSVVVLAAAVGIWRTVGPHDRAAAPVVASHTETARIDGRAPAATTRDDQRAPQPAPRSDVAGDLGNPMQLPRSVRRPSARSAPPAPAAEPPFTDVLISEDEVRALNRLVELATASARTRAAGVALPQEDAELTDIDIAPVTIEPLPQMARLEL